MDLVQEKKEQGKLSLILSFLGIEERKSKIILFLSLIAVFLSLVASFFSMPPADFPQGKTITIERGDSLYSVSELFYKENIVRSRSLFELCAKVVGGEKPIIAGDYFFKEPESVCIVAARVARGISGVPTVRITIPEGMSHTEMAAIFQKQLPQFDRNVFFETLWSKEGFLFPDTYFFPENVTVQAIGEKMFANFEKQIKPLEGDIEASGHPLRDIVIMASILEKEAATAEDRALVSGILWKRIKMGMPLQVDATFMYLLGKKSSELTLGDLQMKSAYNTYTNKGLPYGPIGNPGVDAIRAAIHPALSPYLYYLSDSDGVMHYAKTFEEHKANKINYLK